MITLNIDLATAKELLLDLEFRIRWIGDRESPQSKRICFLIEDLRIKIEEEAKEIEWENTIKKVADETHKGPGI